MGSERDEFDEIIRGLDLNVPFPEDNDVKDTGDDTDDIGDSSDDFASPDDAPTQAASWRSEPAEPELSSPDDQILPGDDLSYRNPPSPPAKPWNIRRLIAITGLIAGPTLLMFATLSGVVLPRPIAYGLALIFVACAVWLIAQLPERGPGRPDSPDDGAEL